MTIGEKLVELRRAAGLTAELLGKKVGLPLDTIYRLERDATRNPGLTTMLRLVRVLGLGLGEFDGCTFQPDRRSRAARA